MTLWRFYKAHRQGMRKLFERTVRTAVRMKLVRLAVQAVDGTKVGANAARERTYDAEGLGKLLERLEGARELEAQNEVDSDHRHIPDKEALREQVREAMAEQQDASANQPDGCRGRLIDHQVMPGYNSGNGSAGGD